MSDSYRALLEKIFDATYEDERAALSLEDYERLRGDLAFHMTDWLPDLHRLKELVDAPESQTVEASRKVLAGFLVHAIPHLRAAGRILVGPPVDAFEDDETAKLLRELENREVEVG